MAKCKYCKQEMTVAGGCVRVPVISNGKEYEPIRVGNEGHYLEYADIYRCGDCGARMGEYHHPGCCMEKCPVCGGQLISCGCMDIIEEDEINSLVESVVMSFSFETCDTHLQTAWNKKVSYIGHSDIAAILLNDFLHGTIIEKDGMYFNMLPLERGIIDIRRPNKHYIVSKNTFGYYKEINRQTLLNRPGAASRFYALRRAQLSNIIKCWKN